MKHNKAKSGHTQGTFAKNSMYNYFSTIIPALIALLYTLILSNYLGPDLYGLYSYLPAILLGAVSLLGGDLLNNILWTFSARYKSKDTFKKILLAEAILLVALFAAVNLFGSYFMSLANASYEEYIPIASLFVIITPFNLIFATLFKGFSNFGKVLKAALIENSITLVLSVVFIIILGWGLEGAFFARFVALGASIIFYIRESRHLAFSPKKANLAEIKKFGSWNAVANFVRALNNQIYVIVQGLFLSIGTIGIYALGERLTTLTIAGPSNALAETMYSKNSENYRNPEIIGKQTGKVIRMSILLNLFLGVFFLVVIPLIIPLLFPKFNGIIVYLPLLVIVQIIQSQAPMLKIFDSLNETKNNLLTNTAHLALVALILVPSTYFFGLAGLLVSNAICIELRYIIQIKLLKRHRVKIDIVPKKEDFVSLVGMLRRSISLLRK